MSSRITLSQIVDNITQLSASVKPDDFIYDFLACFGLPKATIARLKGGGLNVAKKDGCTLLKTKVYFEPVRADLLKTASPRQAIEVAQKDPKVAANKPRFLIATDFKTVTAFDTKRKDSVEFPIGDLHEHYPFFLPLAGMEKSTVHAEAEADVKAAENMAKLYDLIRADNPPVTGDERHALNVFLTRLLFCYFAEDTGIFPDKSFTSAVESYTQADGSDLSGFLRQLFLALNTAPESRGKTPKHLAGFPYVNGGLFRDTHTLHSVVPSFSTKSRQKLIELGQKSWREINPDIFGSMFQGVVDDEKRAELGMHYTSVPNIMKVIKPLFLDELYGDFEKAKGAAGRLNKLLSRIYRLRLFDPACGSGNFLIIAYKELRRLEMAIYKELLLLTGQLPFSFSGIQVSQFYGIELDDFAHEIAILALWLAEHQMNIEFEAAFEKTPASLPLKDGAKVVCDDATKVDWAKICPLVEGNETFVLGNPPYLGARNQEGDSKDAVYRCYNGAPEHRDADLISCWFIKGATYIAGQAASLAFVTTNSVCQGDHVAILWPRVLGNELEIHFAHTSFKWSNSAKNNAAVICVIVGLRPKANGLKWIFSGDIKSVASNINPYLAKGSNTVIGRRDEPLCPLFPDCVMGSMARDGGNLILSREERDELLANHPQSRPLIRYLIGAQEFVRSERRWCLWIEDAHLDLAKSIPPIAERIQKIYRFRTDSTANTTNGYAAIPHQFAQRAHRDGSSIIIPSTTSERRHYIPMGYLDSGSIIPNSAQAIYHAEPWIFGVISSEMHMVWVRTVAGRLKSDYRYSSSICYNNFPFPAIEERQRAIINMAAEEVLTTREKHPAKTIAQLYDPDTMPADLLSAHRALDKAVEQCYRAKPFSSDEERLEYLFSLYEKMAAQRAGELFTAAASEKTRAKAKNS
jgi:hypothetical protein